MKGAGDAAFALQLANVAQIDEGHVVAAVLRDRFFDRQGLDLTFGGVDQRPKSRANFLRHRSAHTVLDRAAAGSRVAWQRAGAKAMRLSNHDPEKWNPVFGKDHAQNK
jgi:hypothetical protein